MSLTLTGSSMSPGGCFERSTLPLAHVCPGRCATARMGLRHSARPSRACDLRPRGCLFEVVRHASFFSGRPSRARGSVDARGASGPLAFAQPVFLGLAGGGFGQFAERDCGGGLEMGEVVAAEVDDLLLACRLP